MPYFNLSPHIRLITASPLISAWPSDGEFPEPFTKLPLEVVLMVGRVMLPLFLACSMRCGMRLRSLHSLKSIEYCTISRIHAIFLIIQLTYNGSSIGCLTSTSFESCRWPHQIGSSIPCDVPCIGQCKKGIEFSHFPKKGLGSEFLAAFVDCAVHYPVYLLYAHDNPLSCSISCSSPS